MKYNEEKNLIDRFIYPIDHYYDNKDIKDENILNELLLFIFILPFYHLVIFICTRYSYLTPLIKHKDDISIKKMNMLSYIFTILAITILGIGFYNYNYTGSQSSLIVINTVFILGIIYTTYLLYIEYKYGNHKITYDEDFSYNPLDKEDLKELQTKKKAKDDLKVKEQLREDKDNYKKLRGK